MVDLTPETPEIPAPPTADDATRLRVAEEARSALDGQGRGSTILTRGKPLGIRVNSGASGGGPLANNNTLLTRGRS